MLASPLPAFDASSAPEDAAAARRPVELSALVGALASALWFVSFFLPWVGIPERERVRFRAALEPSIESLADREPEHAVRYRILMQQVVEEGHLSGLDLHHYARTALALNRTLIGTDPQGHALERPWLIQRVLLAAGLLLAALPILCAVMMLLLVARGFRRTGSAALATLIVIGFVGMAVAVSWLQFAGRLDIRLTTGDGLYLALFASVAQACAGLFAVTASTWWRVYFGAVLAMAALGFAASRFVATGSVP